MSIIGNENIRYSGTQSRQIKESVLDTIIDTAPMQTPLIAMCKRGRSPKGIFHEWMIDYSGAYPTTSTDINTRGEGDDADPVATSERQMLKNNTHIIGRSWSVTHTQEIVDKYGVASEFDYQAAKQARLLVREANWALLNSTIADDASNPPNTSSGDTNRTMAGLSQLLDVPSGVVANGTVPTGAKGTNNTQAGANLAVTDITTVQKSTWTNGGVVNGSLQALANGTEKMLASELFAPTSTITSLYRRKYGTSEANEINLPIDLVVTDFGELHFHLDQAVPSGLIHAFDPEFFEINVLRDFEVIELAKTGPSKHGMVEVELSCSLLAPNTAWTLNGVA